MARPEYYCTDPSHPPIFHYAGQASLYAKVSGAISELEPTGASPEDIVQQVVADLANVLARPSEYVMEGLRVQGLRREIARDWGEVFNRLENLAYLTAHSMLSRAGEGSELHLVQGLLALEAMRNLLATVNQLRSALASETLGYLRTVYEIYVKSRFLARFAGVDADLPGRFSYFTNSTYLGYYLRFGASHSEDVTDNDWAEAEKFFASRYPDTGKGNYGWAYPHILSSNGKQIKQPTFRHLMDKVDGESRFYKTYYEVSSSKTHGQFLFGTSMTGAARTRVFRPDSYSMADIDAVLKLLLPLYKDILKNAAHSCSIPKNALVIIVAISAITDLEDCVAEIAERIDRRYRPASTEA